MLSRTRCQFSPLDHITYRTNGHFVILAKATEVIFNHVDEGGVIGAFEAGRHCAGEANFLPFGDNHPIRIYA